MALTCEMLRSELEAFAEQTLQTHLNRLENRLLQGVQNEIQNLSPAGSSPKPSGAMRKPSPAPQRQGKADTLSVPHALPPGQMNVEDLENEFRFIGKWAETVDRDPSGAQPARSPRPQNRSPRSGQAMNRTRTAKEDLVTQVQERQDSKQRKAKVYRGPGAPPPDLESIEPLRTYVMASEMHEIDKAQRKSQQKGQSNIVRAFTSKKSIPALRKTIPNIFIKTEDQNNSQDESKNTLQAAGRADSRDRISTGSADLAAIKDTPGDEDEDDKGTEQRQSEQESDDQEGGLMKLTSQMEVAENPYNGRDSHFSFEDDQDTQNSQCYICISSIVKNPWFDYTSALMIFLNAISIGVQTDWSAENYMKSVPQSHRIVDYCFCAVFTLELVLRLYIFRMDFFFCPDWKWNVFDTVLVTMQLVEEILNVFATNMQGLNFSFMRILRILRLVRIVRLFRVVRVITELRTIVSSIAGCMKSLFSTLVLLLLMIYVVGVFFTQLVSDHHANRSDKLRVEALDLYYESLSRSILSLYCAMSGGVDWENMVNPLIDNISPVLAVVFSLYIAFAVLAMMNVVTGVFVESALLSAKEDKDIYMVNHMRALLKSTDIDNSGTITWDEFQGQLSNPQMVELFRSIDVDIREARGLFDLLDMNDLGRITTDQFVTGCLRLRGHAKSLDLSLLIHEQRRISKRTFSHIRYVESQLTYMCEMIGYVDQNNASSPLLKVNHEFEV